MGAFRGYEDVNLELSARVAALIEPALTAMGYELVRVAITGGSRPVLQVMAEPIDGRTMNVDDCAAISEVVSALLDVEDPVSGAYSLEVSSPGLDRPLTRPKDFDRFAGFEVKIEMAMPVAGRRRFRGLLQGTGAVADRDEVAAVVAMDDDTVLLPLADIVTARLVLTDALIDAAMKGGLPGAPAQAPQSGETDDSGHADDSGNAIDERDDRPTGKQASDVAHDLAAADMNRGG